MATTEHLGLRRYTGENDIPRASEHLDLRRPAPAPTGSGIVPAMRSTSILIAVVAAACGAPAKSPAPAVPTEPAPAPAAAGPAATPTPPAAVVVDATPDKPSGADAARDAELAKAASAAIEAFVNGQSHFTRDGKRIVFVSDRDGLPQLYIADAGKLDAPVTRLVTSTERTTGPVLTPDGKALVFQSDHGADENWTFFRINLDGSGLVELTPGIKRQRNPAFIPDGKPDAIFYSARAMSDVGTGVYTTSAKAPGEEKQIYHDDKPGTLVDVSRDGKWGLYQRYPSRSENYLIAVDLATGATRPVWPKEGKVSIHNASFSADGKRAIIATDGGAEQACCSRSTSRAARRPRATSRPSRPPPTSPGSPWRAGATRSPCRSTPATTATSASSTPPRSSPRRAWRCRWAPAAPASSPRTASGSR